MLAIVAFPLDDEPEWLVRSELEENLFLLRQPMSREDAPARSLGPADQAVLVDLDLEAFGSVPPEQRSGPERDTEDQAAEEERDATEVDRGGWIVTDEPVNNRAAGCKARQGVQGILQSLGRSLETATEEVLKGLSANIHLARR